MKNILILLLLISGHCFGQADLTRGLKAYYPFSGNAKDVSGNNNHPVFNNATLTSDRFGNSGMAYHFDGVRTYMKILNSPSLNTNTRLSICVWVKPQGFYSGKCHGNAILMKGDADYLTGNYMLRFDDSHYTNGSNCYDPVDRLHQNFYGNGVPGVSAPYIKPNKWYSVVVTYDGSNAKLYVDCKLVSTYPQSGLTFTNRYDIFLGRTNSDEYPYWFKGDMDELRIYNRALSEQEIKAICDETAATREPPYVKEKNKEKKNIVSAKQKKAAAKPGSVSEMNPLIANNKAPEIAAGMIDTLNFTAEKEIVLEERKNELVRSFTVDHDSISVTLYDNGIVDGDSITLIYNDVLLTTHKLLTEKPLTFWIKVKPGNQRNELKMYAENLGSIPPNTALMVIYDGNKRYEVNIKSTEKSNGSVSFKLRE